MSVGEPYNSMASTTGIETPHSPLAVPVLMGIVFLSLIGFGVVIPLLPFYATVFHASPWQVTLMFAVFAGGQFFGELVWGRLSDQIGRKPVIIGTILICSLGYLALAFAPNIWLAILARLIAGFFSGNISTIQGYIVDVSPRDRVAGRLGMVGSAFGVGFIVGPTLGGLLARPELGEAGFRPPLLVASVLCVLAAGCTVIFVRESRRRGESGGRRGPGPLQALAHALTDRVLQRLLATTFFSFGGFSAMWSVFGLWGSQRFGWGPKEIGGVMALTGVVSASSQGLFSGIVARRVGETRTVIGGLLCAGGFMLAQAVGLPAPLAIGVMLVIVLSHTMTQPANATMVSSAAPHDQQGATLGANNAASAVARVLGPMAAGLAFSAVGPWAPFVVGAASLSLAAAMAYFGGRALTRRLHSPEPLV